MNERQSFFLDRNREKEKRLFDSFKNWYDGCKDRRSNERAKIQILIGIHRLRRVRVQSARNRRHAQKPIFPTNDSLWEPSANVVASRGA